MAHVDIRRGDRPEPPEQFRWAALQEGSSEPGMFPGLVERETGVGEFRGMEFLHVEARRIVNEIPAAARLPFRYTINAYRGCSHACAYCFARPTHEYLNLDPGREFETKIVVKVNAAERLRAELAPRRWKGDHIAMGTNTDPYQRCEGKYRLTRKIVETLAEYRNPFSILTKSTLVLRDLDLLAAAARRTDVSVNLSIGTLDDDVWRLTEPGTPRPAKRIEAVARLNEAGVRSGVMVAPVIPGLSDAPEQLEAVVRAAVDAGARTVSPILLHLRPGVRELFLPWLEEHRPDLVDRYLDLYGRGGYAPKRAQEALAAQVRRLVERWGGAVPDGGHPRFTRAVRPGDGDGRPDPGPPAEQLRLLG